MRIVDVKCTKVFIPYNPPFGPYLGSWGPAEGTRGAASLIVEVVTDEGLTGWGESNGDGRPDLALLLNGENPFALERILDTMRAREVSRYVRSAVEMALWDIIGKAVGRPLYDLLGGCYRPTAALCACQGIVAPEQAGEIATAAVSGWGFRTLKTKAGLNLAQDVAIIRSMRAAVGPAVALRPDPNTAYSVEDARQLLSAYREVGVQYVEDPCHASDLGNWRALHREFGLPLALNMGLGTLNEALRLVSATDAVAVWLPDPTAAGGILEVKKIAHLAGAAGVACGMHCAHDLGIKTAAVAHIAVSSPSFTLACDTLYHALADDLLAQPLAIVDGAMEPSCLPGLGIDVDQDKIGRYRVDQ